MNILHIRFFLILLAGLIGCILVGCSVSAYKYYEAIHSDDPIDPRFEVQSGNGKIIRGDIAIDLAQGESYELADNDAVETGKESIGVVHWPDRSITRLGSDTRIIIEKMEVSRDYTKIQISYEMKRGKVWNNVIRLLLGDSYFEARLPKDQIVAGVRGTTFEVNLEKKYIQAVEHQTHLSDRSGKSLDLYPGELVSSENIWIRKGREWVDTTWNDLNVVSDTTYKALRNLEIKKRLETFGKSSGSYFSFESIFQKIFAFFPGFESLEISQYLESGNIAGLEKFDSAVLLEYYQKVSGIASPEYRDALRTSLLSRVKTDAASIELRGLLEKMSVWESLDTGKLLPEAEKYLKEKGIDTTDFRTKFQNGMKQDTQKFLENFSGSLEKLF